MASGQNDTRPTTFPPQHAGVKRTRTQEGQQPVLAGGRRKGNRHDSNGGAHREKCTQQSQTPASRKRPRTQCDTSDGRRKRRRGSTEVNTSAPASLCNPGEDEQHPIAYWAAKKQWPQQYFKKGKDMENILAIKRSNSARSRKNSDTDSATPSSTNQGEPKSREQKSAEYRSRNYELLLVTKGVFMEESELEISGESKRKCQRLLEQGGEVPEHSLFRDDLFKATCQKVRRKNEARVIQDISRLIVPSAETLTTYGATNLKDLIESVNEGWNNSVPITKTRPQPDYAVGFRREAFKQEQLDRMHPIIGDYKDFSYFMATPDMYFPFLTCEVKCGDVALDIADRQNAHSAAIAVRAVVELFRAVKREKELHREILAFSVSHDYATVRIYGHYAEFEGADTKYYRHTIRRFDFTELDGRDKWSAYKFTKNVYDNWMPTHFERICSAIDQIPAGISFSVSQSELHYPEQSSGLSQDLNTHSISQSSVSSASEHPQDDTQSSGGQDTVVTPGTSVHEGAPFKIPRKQHARRGRK